MPFFETAEEIYTHVGGAMRAAATHPEAGPALAAADLVVQLYLTEPDATLTFRLSRPVTIEEGGGEADADVVMWMSGDITDRFWRGEYNLAVGLATGAVKAQGPVDKVLDLVPVIRALFPTYCGSVARKDRGVA